MVWKNKQIPHKCGTVFLGGNSVFALFFLQYEDTAILKQKPCYLQLCITFLTSQGLFRRYLYLLCAGG